MTKDTLVIVGSHEPSRHDFDWSRDDCDVWLMNEACAPDGWAAANVSRVDAFFQMHAETIWRNPNNHTNKMFSSWLMAGRTPRVYMQAQFPDVPQSVRYPLDELCDELLGGLFDKRLFTSSLAYCVALGVYQRRKTIELYGIGLENDTEYRYQRESYAFWTGLAVGRGIRVIDHGKFFDQPLYGYEGDVTLPLDYFRERLAEITPGRDEATEKYTTLHAQFTEQAAQYVETGRNYDELVGTLKELAVVSNTFGKYDGSRAELERYLKKAEDMQAEYGAYAIVRGEFERSAAINLKTANEKKQQLDATAGALGNAWGSVEKEPSQSRRRRRMQAEILPLANQYLTFSIWTGVYSGAYAEGVRCMVEVDSLVKAAGGTKSEAAILEQMGISV